MILDAEVAKLHTLLVEARQPIFKQYGEKLETMYQEAKKLNHLDALLSIRQEQERVSAAGDVPDVGTATQPDFIQKIRQIYHQQIDQLERNKRKKQAELMRQFQTRLMQLQAAAIQLDDLDLAVDLKQEATGLTSVIQALEDEKLAPVPQETQGKPMPAMRYRPGGARVNAVAFSPRARVVIVGDAVGRVVVFDAKTGKPQRKLEGLKTAVADLAVSSSLAAASTREKTRVLVWNWQTGKRLHTLNGDKGMRPIQMSFDGRRLITGGLFRVKLFDLTTGKVMNNLETSGYSVALAGNGHRMIFGGYQKVVHVKDTRNGESVATFTGGHTAHIYALDAARDGTRFASSGPDKQVCVWEIGSRMPLHKLSGHSGTVHELEFSADGSRLLSRGSEVILWDVATGSRLMMFRGCSGVPDLAQHGQSLLLPVGHDVLGWRVQKLTTPVSLAEFLPP